MKVLYSLIYLGCLPLVSSFVFADVIQGTSFSNQEWEIYCSNTGTCRAAGYQDDLTQAMPASILLTRKAGAKQAVQAEFALSDYDQSLDKKKLKNIHFYINGKDLGVIHLNGTNEPLMGTLNAKQVNGLLQQVKKNVKSANCYY